MQQVNLYVPELRPQRDWLNAKSAALLCLLLIAVMLTNQIVQGLRANAMAGEIAQQEAAVAEMQNRVSQLQGAAQSGGAQSFEDRIAQLELAIANRKKVGRILSGQNLGNARGFQASMRTLARQSNDDIALRRFTIGRGGSYVQMQGTTKDAKAVPLYLQRLKEEPVFSETRFGLLSVSSEPKEAAGLFEFALGYDNLYVQKPKGSSQ